MITVRNTVDSAEERKRLNPDAEKLDRDFGISEAVNHPAHYNSGGIECIDGIKAALSPEEFKGFLKGNVMKYLWRANHKNGDEDIEKARWYLEYLARK